MMIAAAELHKRYRDHSRQFKLTARRLADFVASAEAEESLLVQRLQDAAARRIRLDAGEKGSRCEHDATLQGESESKSEPELALREPAMAKRKPVPPPELYEEY
jgi:hypothetical protein